MNNRDVGMPFAGLRVMIVEDEYLVADDLARGVRAFGANTVGPVPTLQPALDLVRRERIDVAFLDLNLNDLRVFPVADELAQRAIPFAFLTGYERALLPPHYRDRPHFEKPVLPHALRRVMTELSGAIGMRQP